MIYHDFFLVYPEHVARLWNVKNEKLVKLLQNILVETPKNQGPKVRTGK